MYEDVPETLYEVADNCSRPIMLIERAEEQSDRSDVITEVEMAG
jgi:hypothetical protein